MASFKYTSPGYRNGSVDPTPEQIATRSAEIRATWSPEEYRRRALGMRQGEGKTSDIQGWTPPLVNAGVDVPPTEQA